MSHAGQVAHGDLVIGGRAGGFTGVHPSQFHHLLLSDQTRPQGMRAFAAHQALRHAVHYQQVGFGQDGRVELLLFGRVCAYGGDVRARADLIGKQQRAGGRN